MNLKFSETELRSLIRIYLFEAINRGRDEDIITAQSEEDILGEPDMSAEDEREDPQSDVDEMNTLAGMSSGLGPNMPMSYDPEKPIYKNKK